MIELCCECLSLWCVKLCAFDSILCSFQNIKDLLIQNKCNIWSLSDYNGIRTHDHQIFVLFCEYLSLWCIWLCVLNVKELLAQNRLNIWSLSDCNWIWTHNHLVCKRTPVWLNGWVFIYDLSDCCFESRCSHLNFR